MMTPMGLGIVRAMKLSTSPVLLCLLLALSIALGSISAGRAAGHAAVEATLTEMVICADGQGQKTILLARDGTPVDLPHCSKLLCEHCLQAGAHVSLGTPFQHPALVLTSDSTVLPGNTPQRPNTSVRTRSRAPPAVLVLA